MKLTGEQIETLAEFADGADCQVSANTPGTMNGEIHTRIHVERDDKETVYIYDTGQIERVVV